MPVNRRPTTRRQALTKWIRRSVIREYLGSRGASKRINRLFVAQLLGGPSGLKSLLNIR